MMEKKYIFKNLFLVFKSSAWKKHVAILSRVICRILQSYSFSNKCGFFFFFYACVFAEALIVKR